MTVSYETPKEKNFSGEDLSGILANAKPATNLKQHTGTINLKEDPVDLQRRIRDEW